MSRTRKLLIVALVLAAGIALAWPFRKRAEDGPTAPPGSTDLLAGILDPSAEPRPPTPAPTRHVAAKMASTGDAGTATSRPPAGGFDVANHPVVARRQRSPQVLPVTPPLPPPRATLPDQPAARPAYATIEQSPEMAADAEWPGEVMHIVQNGDTLEKLAKRYLGDSGRALEIFELNRDRLTNPHLLPIDAPLRIPVAPGHVFD